MRKILARFPGLSRIWYDVPFYIPDIQSYLFYEAVCQSDPRILVNERAGNGYGDFLVPGDNTIPDPNAGPIGPFETIGTILQNIGEWLTANQEALYGTRSWLVPLAPIAISE